MVGICTAGNGRDVPKSPSHGIVWIRFFFIPAHASAAWSLSFLGAVSLSLGLLPVFSHRAHPTRCVLNSALQTTPGSRVLPRDISVCSVAKEQLRQVLMRTEVS